jgi:hypothetical protein
MYTRVGQIGSEYGVGCLCVWRQDGRGRDGGGGGGNKWSGIMLMDDDDDDDVVSRW